MTTRTLGASGHAGSWCQARAAVWWIAFCSAAPAALSAAHAQVIAVRTAPIADGGQFTFLPSANLGMGGLSIALADSTLDPFVNPAKASRLRGARVFGSPAFFSVSREAGGGLTLPIGTSVSSGAWFSQFVVAMQEVEPGGPDDEGTFFTGSTALDAGMADVEDEKPSRQNRYLHATLGRRVGNRGLAIAASASWWGLHAMDGVELYYPGSQSVRQSGDALDLRLGAYKEWRGQSLEALVVHNRLGMNQDVAFSDLFWNPSLRQIEVIPRTEPNADRVETWGLHLGYTRLLSDSAWRVGGSLTANRIRQPRMPNYELPLVPADDGSAHAYNLGVGIARTGAAWTFGVDAILEPIWSRSWDRAAEATETRSGTPIDAGATTLDNRFRFTNGILRGGVSTTSELSTTTALSFEFGGQWRGMRYRLEQQDAIRESANASTQSWNEWTRSWGMSLRFPGGDLRYRGSLTTGGRRPGVDTPDGVILEDALSSSRPGFAVPFRSFVTTTFDDVRVTVHQISLSVGLR